MYSLSWGGMQEGHEVCKQQEGEAEIQGGAGSEWQSLINLTAMFKPLLTLSILFLPASFCEKGFC